MHGRQRPILLFALLSVSLWVFAVLWVVEAQTQERYPQSINQRTAPIAPAIPTPVTHEGTLVVNYGDPAPGQIVEGTIEMLLFEETGRAIAVDIPVGEAQPYHGQRVRVTGFYRYDRANRQAEPTLTAQRLEAIDGPQDALGTQRWINVLCKFSDIANEPDTSKVSQYFGGDVEPYMEQYWDVVSYGLVDTIADDITAWFDMPHPVSHYDAGNGQADTAALLNDCVAAADASVDFSQYEGVNMLFNASFANFVYGGGWYLDLDGEQRLWRFTWLSPSVWQGALGVMAHEMGHGYGFPHSSGPYGQIYDSAWDQMSGGGGTCVVSYTDPNSCMQMGTIAFHLTLADWVDPQRRIVVPPNSSAEVTLDSLATAANGNNAIMVEIPVYGSDSFFYTVEARTHHQYDRNLFYEGVVIHEVVRNRPEPAHVMDASFNGNPNDEGGIWQPGETFSDNAGIEIEVLSRTNNTYRVRISNTVDMLIPGLHDDRDDFISYDAGWSQTTDGAAYETTLSQTNTPNATATMTISGGRELTIYRTIGPNYGDMEVCIGGNCQTISNNNASRLVQQPVTLLTPNAQALTVSIRNAGNMLELDAVDVVPYISTQVSTVAQLINAIEAANNSVYPYRIELAPNTTFTFTDGPYDWNGSNALPLLLDSAPGTDIVIEGNGSTFVRDSTDPFRFVYVRVGAEIEIHDLTMQGGSGVNDGGAFFNEGTARLHNMTFRQNSANWGGAIANHWDALLTIEDSLFENNNTSQYAGAAITVWDSETIIRRSIFNNNSSPDWGGAINNSGQSPLLIEDTTFTNNTATINGGAINNYNSPLTVRRSDFSYNTAGDRAGGILGNDGSVIIVQDTTFEGNQASSGGGMALFSSTGTVRRSTFKDNIVTNWGGGFDGYLSTITVEDTLFEGNEAGSSGVAVGQELNIYRSTFEDNDIPSGWGAAVHMDRGTIHNSTFVVPESHSVRVSVGPATISHSTFYAPDANSPNIGVDQTATANVFANILYTGYIQNCGGPVVSLGYNISSDTTCAYQATDRANQQPQLNMLADNGGYTPTMALQASSPALDIIPNANCTTNRDQRLALRGADAGCDAGAYERNSTAYSYLDINQDGVVAPDDVIFVINRLGLSLPNVDVRADVNGDQTVNADDALQILEQLGTVIP